MSHGVSPVPHPAASCQTTEEGGCVLRGRALLSQSLPALPSRGGEAALQPQQQQSCVMSGDGSSHGK